MKQFIVWAKMDALLQLWVWGPGPSQNKGKGTVLGSVEWSWKLDIRSSKILSSAEGLYQFYRSY